MNTQFDTAPGAAGSVASGREWRSQRALALIRRRLTPSWWPFPVNKLTPDAGNPPARRRAGPAALFMMLCASSALAGAVLPPGDAQLRSDIQLLAAWNIVTGPTSTWPIAWRQLETDLNAAVDPETFPSHVEQALSRVRLRMTQALHPETFLLGSRAAVSGTTGVMRSFQSVPREDAELSGQLRWLGDRLSVQVAATGVRDASDGQDVRADGSMVGLTMGNTTVAVGVVDRWWGPGWDGSLILSSNARPFPAMTIDRNVTTAFASRWLSWIGPWDMSVIAGRLESDRFVPGAQFLGLRLTARPIRSLEVGLSRTALWCGTGRPCDFETFVDLFRGNDNRGDSGVSDSNEPGNQLAGIDIRWSPAWFDRSFAMYGQFIGEDEAGGLPSRYLGLLGIERSGALGNLRTYRWFAEYAGTSCDFYKRSEIFNCAYNHTIYQTGYRYRGRTIGHAADNDSKVITLGAFITGDDERTLQGTVRVGRLNRIGPPDPKNTLTPVRQDLVSVDLAFGFSLDTGRLQLGVGYDHRQDIDTVNDDSGARAYVEWRNGTWF